MFSKVLSHLILKIKSFSVIIFLSKDSCVYKILYFVSLPAIDVYFFSRESVGVSHCMCVWSALFHTFFLS